LQKKLFLLLCIIGAMFLNGCCCATGDSDTKVKEGSIAPAFSLKDVNEQTLALGRLKGKVVFLNFWRSG
jgi:hypothetical protein